MSHEPFFAALSPGPEAIAAWQQAGARGAWWYWAGEAPEFPVYRPGAGLRVLQGKGLWVFQLPRRPAKGWPSLPAPGVPFGLQLRNA
jgi:hypothetical protein